MLSLYHIYYEERNYLLPIYSIGESDPTTISEDTLMVTILYTCCWYNVQMSLLHTYILTYVHIAYIEL